ncbi:MAG: molybdopterin-dependent oxidoreductase [Chloroflexi bacterium]|nr:molybdopterin-dependent oxidoreductase [Chloroflexota bacterium]
MGVSVTGWSLASFLAACQRAADALSGVNAAEPTKQIAAQGAPANPALNLVNGIPITSNEDFYTVWYSRGAPPAVPVDWKLRIGGLVDNPLEFTFDQLKTLPAVTEMRTLECISNPVGGELISNAMWKGVRLKDLLARAQVKNAGIYLKLESLDGFYTGIPIELGLMDNSLLAYEMNGTAIPRDHGAPLRCLWPGRYGMKQPKWLHTITVVDKPFLGYWEKQGWTNDAFVNPNARIDAPKDFDVVSGATFTLSGVAYSSEAGIAKIEISADDTDKWLEADLTRGPSPYVWTIWKWSGPALAPGRHTLYARVTEKSGRVQTKPQKIRLLDGTYPNGTDEMHSILLDFRA